LIQPSLLERLQRRANEWAVACERSFETESSVITFGRRGNQAVVLKLVKHPGDEWHSGQILEVFNGNGCVQVYQHEPGAVLVEKLQPGHSLSELTLADRDEEATEILANVILQMSAAESPLELSEFGATVESWGKGFAKYIATGDDQISMSLVEAGQQVYASLCASQTQPRLLHGDLQHYNVLFDSERGWLAIDPKGVAGELEYEVGAFMRNPFERPDLFLSRSIVERRLNQLTAKLNLNYERALAWSFAQAVLSAIWKIEDGSTVNPTDQSLSLANIIRPMLGNAC
jgi:streptomycin 6-kinase